jgi:hypothetical protein
MNFKEKSRLLVKPGKNREEMKKFRNQGLILLHEGLLDALEIGCKPHSSKDT